MTVTLDKTFAQIQAAIQAGKKPVAKIPSGDLTVLLPLAVVSEENIIFSVIANEDGQNFSYSVRLTSAGNANLTPAISPSFNSDGFMPQVSMAADPTEDMQIATKQYVDDSIESGAGSSVQSDWNQNDATAADYVKNRPFYTGDPVETVLVEESTVTFADVDDFYLGGT